MTNPTASPDREPGLPEPGVTGDGAVRRRRPTAALLVGGALALALAAGGAAGAYAATTGEDETGGDQAETRGPGLGFRGPADGEHRDGEGRFGRRGPGGHGGPLGELLGAGAHPVHGESVVETADGEFVTIVRQVGEVTAVDGESVTVESADGFSLTWQLDDETAVRSRDGEAALADIDDGEEVRLAGELVDDTATAAVVGLVAAEEE